MAPCVGYFTVKKMDLREKKKKRLRLEAGAPLSCSPFSWFYAKSACFHMAS